MILRELLLKKPEFSSSFKNNLQESGRILQTQANVYKCMQSARILLIYIGEFKVLIFRGL